MTALVLQNPIVLTHNFLSLSFWDEQRVAYRVLCVHCFPDLLHCISMLCIAHQILSVSVVVCAMTLVQRRVAKVLCVYVCNILSVVLVDHLYTCLRLHNHTLLRYVKCALRTPYVCRHYRGAIIKRLLFVIRYTNCGNYLNLQQYRNLCYYKHFPIHDISFAQCTYYKPKVIKV